MLLDQDNVEHVIKAFRPDPSSSAFWRPRRESNIASGCPMFCSLAELNNHAYIRDDAMFLKIIVDTSDLADLQGNVREQEISSYDGLLLWKIPDYTHRRNDAVSGQQVSFYSPCFYTSRHGYKMCARIYFNGDGMGRGTHISMFFTGHAR